MIHTYTLTPEVVSDIYHVWAEHLEGSKIEIGEFDDVLWARGQVNRYLLKLPTDTPLPKIVIERVTTFKEYLP